MSFYNRCWVGKNGRQTIHKNTIILTTICRTTLKKKIRAKTVSGHILSNEVPLSKDSSGICQLPVAAAASGPLMLDAQMSGRRLISLQVMKFVSHHRRSWRWDMFSEDCSFANRWHKVKQTFWQTLPTATLQVPTEFINSLWICYCKVSLCSSKTYWDQCSFTQYCLQYKSRLFKKTLHWITATRGDEFLY